MELHARVKGRVQMVMFRDFVRRNSSRLGLCGTVKNLPDGSVEVVAQGEEDVLKELIRLLRRGPFLARVDTVAVEWRKLSGEFDGFTIEYE